MTSGYLFNNLSPVKLTSCCREVDFRRPVQQPTTGQVNFLLQESCLPATCSTICHRSSSLPATRKLTSGYLFNNRSPVNFTSCYKEVDFRLPVQQSVSGSSSLPATRKLTSGYLFHNQSPAKFTSCYKEVDPRLVVNNHPPFKSALSFRFRSLPAFGQSARSLRSRQLLSQHQRNTKRK